MVWRRVGVGDGGVLEVGVEGWEVVREEKGVRGGVRRWRVCGLEERRCWCGEGGLWF